VGKKLSYKEKYNKVEDLKIQLTKYYNENQKLDGRGIDKCAYLPSANYIIKLFRDVYNNINITFIDIYNILNLDMPSDYEFYFNRNKYTYEQLFEIFKSNNCELLSTTFVNVNSYVDYRCSCGNISVIKIEDFLQGHRCNECGKEKSINKRKLSFKSINKYM
jgi:hypothetical protein